MKKKYIAYVLAVAVLGVGLAGAGVASAHGWFGGMASATPEEAAARHTAMFQDQASLLGVSVDAVKNSWAEGKTLLEIAQANGMTADQLAQKMKDAHLAKIKTQFQTLVS
ncbi:MAG: hypothetical protein AAB967_02860, partial [Patescibacteria group bacterium]